MDDFGMQSLSPVIISFEITQKLNSSHPVHRHFDFYYDSFLQYS